MTPNPAAPAGADLPISLYALTPRERNRLRLLAQRYQVRRDTTLRPVADVLLDRRLRYGLSISSGSAISLPRPRLAGDGLG